MSRKTLLLLESLMAGHEMTAEDLDDLLRAQTEEDLHLDYKHGDELKDRRKGSATLRQYLSGFANSAGGVLIVGVDQRTWSVTGCPALHDTNLGNWASDCLTPIAAHFTPPPRFQVVVHSKGDVLVAAASRSVNLVPAIEAGHLVYYFRFHDKTLRAPEYLLSDLVLGRREHPHLHILDINGDNLDPVNSEKESRLDLAFHTALRYENAGLSWARGVQVGIISRNRYQFGIPLNDNLCSYFDMLAADEGKFKGHSHVIHTRCGADELRPFDTVWNSKLPTYTVPLREQDAWCTPYVWKAAAYILSTASSPVWYQLSLVVNDGLLKRAHGVGEKPDRECKIELKQLIGERPVVGWEVISE